MSLFSKHRGNICHNMAEGKVCLILIVLVLVLVPVLSYSQTTYYSRATGDWNVASTWSTVSCNGAAAATVPSAADNAIICAAHTVLNNGSGTINNITINTNGTLDMDGSNLIVNGNLTLNGQINNGGRLRLDGVNKNIDGLGLTDNSIRVEFRVANKIILSTANITFGRDVQVQSGVTVTNYGTVTMSKNLNGQSSTSIWINESNSRLNVAKGVLNNGVLNATATGNTVNYNQAGAQTIKLSTASTYFHLELQGSNIKSLASNTTILGDLIITSTLNVVAGSNWSLSVGGDWNNSGIFEEQLGTVTFDGSGAQSITNIFGETFHDMTINKSGGSLTLNNNVTVSGINPGTFTMTQGNIDASAGTLILGDACGNEGTLSYSSGQILGRFERWINTPGVTFLFPVGSSSLDRPANVKFNDLAPCGSLIAEFITSTPGTNGLPLSEAPLSPADSVRNTFVEGYWTLTVGNGLGSIDYNLDLEGNGFSSFSINSSSRLLTRSSAGSPWTLNGVHSGATGDTTHRANITLLSAQYAFGDTSNCTGPITSAISGADSVCTDDVGLNYSVINTPGSSYSWTVTGGAITAGQGLNQITVTWGSTGMEGNVQVVETNSCTQGTSVNRVINIHTLAPSSITGDNAVAQFSDSVSYSVISRPGYTYTWAITGGTLILGQGTDSILVKWGAQGSGNVRVTASTGCGSGTPVDFPVTIYTTITSIASGDWDVASTWDCNCVPATTDNVVIADGHVVTLRGNEKINNFEIQGPTGQLNDGGAKLTVTGNFIVNGLYTGTSRLELAGTSVVNLSGTGTISNAGFLDLNGGNVNITAGSNLSVTGGNIRFKKVLTVTNNGTVSFNFDIENGVMGTPTTVTWVNEANSTLNIGGTLLLIGTLSASASGNTINYNGGSIQNIKCPSAGQYYHLTISNAGTKTLLCNLDLDGNFSLLGTAQLDVSSYNLTIAGNWSNTSTHADPFFQRSQSVIFDGTANQSVTRSGGETLYGLILNKGSGDLILNDNLIALDAITMTSGNIIATTGIVILGSLAGDGTLTRSSGAIIGQMERYLSASGTKLFPIGTAVDYRPASVTFNAIGAGSLIAEFITTAPGVDGLFLIESGDSIKNTFTEGFWSFTAANGLTSTNYDLDLSGNGFTSQTIYASTRILKRANATVPWTLDGTHVNADPVSSTAKRAGLNNISDFEFCFGDTTQCASAATSAITGLDSVCISAAGVAYSVVLNTSSSYTWVITSGTQVSGSNTNSITVNWSGAPGQVGKVQVVESNNCGVSDTVSLSVNIHTLPTSPVTGRVAVAESSTGVDYSVVNTPGYTYNWYITKGTQASGGTGNAITVDWGLGPDTGKVQVVATTDCGAADTSTISVIIYQSIHSITTGDWSNPLTWDCNCIPTSTDNVVIDSPHIVTLTGNITGNNLEISAGAEFSNSTFTLDLTGEYDYIVHGTHSGTGTTLLRGTVTFWGGTGTITNTGNIEIKGGPKQIIAAAVLTKAVGDIIIDPGVIVNNFGNITLSGDIIGLDGASNWTNEANSTLNASGTVLSTGILNASTTGNTVNYNGSTAQTIKCASSGQYHHLTSSGGGSKSLECNLNVNGNLTISGTSQIDATAANYNITLGGNWANTSSNADAFVQQLGTVTFDGTVAQTITNTAGELFYNLTINKSGDTLTLNNNVSVAGTLTMTSGNTDATSGTLTLGTGTTQVGSLSHTSGTILGNFERWFNTTADPAPPVLYPVGTAVNYRPVNITLNSLPTNGRLTGSFVATAPGNSGLPIVDGAFTIDSSFTEGFWTLSPTGLSSTDYNLELIGNGFSSFTMAAETRILKRAASGPWATTDWGTHVAADPSTNTSKRKNLNGFGEFAFGDTAACAGPLTSAITGADSVCTGTLGSPYSVDLHAGNTYFWVIIGGTQASGGTTNSITVDWGSTGQVGTVRVTEVDECVAGTPRDTAVNIHTLPTSAITGNTAPQQSSTDPYTVTKRPGYSYTWSVVNGNGAIVFGQGTDSIRVNWTATGPDIVRVVASTPCGSASAVDLSLQVSGLISSTGLGGGSWTDPAIWDCVCIPTSADNVIIRAPDIISTTVNDTVNRLTIKSGAIFDNDFTFIINENFIDSGTVIGSGDIHLDGIGSTISGNGTIGNTGTIRIRNGDKTIESTSTLTRAGTGDIRILSDISVTNNGSLSTGGNLVGSNAGSTWTQGPNSSLSASQDVLTIGTLNASATGNTVNYNGTSTQQIKEPSVGGYYNLANNGSDSTKLNINTVISGNVTIGAGKVLDANGFNINVTGDWTNSGGTFSPGNGSVTFDASGIQTITNAAGERFHDIIIASTSTVQTSGASDNLNIQGNWSNNGTFNQQTGTVTFNGSTGQAIAGSAKTTFNNLTINNAAGVALSGATDLAASLTLTSGTFNTGGQDFTLISNSSATARIAEITGGDISGNIIMQRHIDAGAIGWHLLAAPVAGSTINDWDQEMVLSGVGGINGNACCPIWRSVRRYDETRLDIVDSGYVDVTSIAAPINVGEGYLVYTGSGTTTTAPFTFDTRGNTNKFSQSLAVSYSSSGSPDNDGWNLVSNPYPSTIDWNAAGWTKTGVDNAIYVWDPDAGVYATYVGGVGSNGGTQFVPSSQAFWVHATAAPTLTASEPVKAITDQVFFKQNTAYTGVLRLKIDGGGFTNETVLRFIDGATDGFDGTLDAYKLGESGVAPYIASIVGDSIDMSINSLKILTNDTIIPIRVNAVSVGTHAVYIEGAGNLPEEYCIILEDTLFNTFTDMRTDTAFIAIGPISSTPKPRLRLHISAPLFSEEIQISCNGAEDGIITASMSGTSDYIWLNSDGDTMKSSLGVIGSDTLSNLSPGNYTVIVSSQAMTMCSQIVETFEIIEPPTLVVAGQITNLSCFGANDGAVDIGVSGGTPPYIATWSGGYNTVDIDNLSAGSYEITMQDSNGCTIAETYEITMPSELVTNVAKLDELCFGNNNGSIVITTNGGVPPYQYSWSNGATGSENQLLMPGNYAVTVTDINGCNRIDSGIIIQAGVQVIAGYTVPTSTIDLADGGGLQFTNISIGATNYIWDFGNGQSSTLKDPLFTFATPGDYEVKLTAFDGACSSSSSNLITVFQSVGIAPLDEDNPGLSVTEADGILMLDVGDPKIKMANISVHNILGQLIFYYEHMPINGQQFALNLKHLNSGVYVVRVSNEQGSQVQKFTIK